MRKFLLKLFNGRYGLNGTDELTRFLLHVAVVFLILSLVIEPFSCLYYGAIFILLLCYLRLFSRNISKRSKENDAYKRLIKKIKRFFNKNR